MTKGPLALFSTDPHMISILSDVLGTSGMALVTCSALETLPQKPYDWLILDNCEIEEIKKAHHTFPHALLLFLFNTNKALPSFNFPLRNLQKPFHINELKKMIMFHEKNDNVLMLKHYVLYPKKRRLVDTQTNQEDDLTEKETQILLFLHQYPGRVFSKEDLLQHIWNYQVDVTTHTLETHIYRLRQKLPSTILLTQRKGYSLCL